MIEWNLVCAPCAIIQGLSSIGRMLYNGYQIVGIGCPSDEGYRTIGPSYYLVIIYSVSSTEPSAVPDKLFRKNIISKCRAVFGISQMGNGAAG